MDDRVRGIFPWHWHGPKPFRVSCKVGHVNRTMYSIYIARGQIEAGLSGPHIQYRVPPILTKANPRPPARAVLVLGHQRD